MTTKDPIEQEFEEILLNHLAADQRQSVLTYFARERERAERQAGLRSILLRGTSIYSAEQCDQLIALNAGRSDPDAELILDLVGMVDLLRIELARSDAREQAAFEAGMYAGNCYQEFWDGDVIEEPRPKWVQEILDEAWDNHVAKKATTGGA